MAQDFKQVSDVVRVLLRQHPQVTLPRLREALSLRPPGVASHVLVRS
jgi:hypothetical protein